MTVRDPQSSDNMDYSSQLQHERHVCKELAARLGQQEEELNDVRQLVGALSVTMRVSSLSCLVLGRCSSCRGTPR